MTKSATISSKGQVVIPAQIRMFFALDAKTKVLFSVETDRIIIQPIKNLEPVDLKEKLTNFKIDSYFRKEWEAKLKNKIAKWSW